MEPRRGAAVFERTHATVNNHVLQKMMLRKVTVRLSAIKAASKFEDSCLRLCADLQNLLPPKPIILSTSQPQFFLRFDLPSQPDLPLCSGNSTAHTRAADLDDILDSGDCLAEFCSTCCVLLTATNAAAHASHDVFSIGNVFSPSRYLPCASFQAESKYSLSLDAIDHLIRILKWQKQTSSKELVVKSVVCMGCPSIHEQLVSSGTDSV